MAAPHDLERILRCGVVAVVRAASGELLADVAEALLAGGVEGIEITFTVPRAQHVLEQVADRLGDKIVLGAGTVLDHRNRADRHPGRRAVYRGSDRKFGGDFAVPTL